MPTTPVRLPPVALSSEPMRPVDTTWLRMDQPNNLMHVNGVLGLGGALDLERVRELVVERLLRIRRFRQRVVEHRGRFRWEIAPDFDLDDHLVIERLPAPGGRAEAEQLFGELMSRPFDRARPLWQFHIVPGYEGGTAVFCRLHHAIGDGVALLLVLLSLCDLEPDGRLAAATPADEAPPPLSTQIASLFGQPVESFASVRTLLEEVMPDAMRLLLHPIDAMRRRNALLRNLAAVGAAGRLAVYSSDPRTTFKGELVVAKRVAWSRRIPIPEIKQVGAAIGGTVNDILVNATAGAMYHYLAAQGEVAPDLVVRAAMPVNLRPLEKLNELGNRFGLAFLGLPVGIADPVERLTALHREADRLKHSAQPLAAYGILHTMGRLPLAAQRLIVSLFGAKATAVMTNVPGPRRRLYLTGRPLEEIFFWVPQAGRLGLGTSILFYCGEARLGIATDAGLVPDPERLIAGFETEWERLRERAGLAG